MEWTFLSIKKAHHSTTAVVVSLVENSAPAGIESVPGLSQCGLRWREMIVLDRVNKAAGKEMIVCFVMKLPSLSQRDMKPPSFCVASLEVREVFVKRWVPEKAREIKC